MVSTLLAGQPRNGSRAARSLARLVGHDSNNSVRDEQAIESHVERHRGGDRAAIGRRSPRDLGDERRSRGLESHKRWGGAAADAGAADGNGREVLVGAQWRDGDSFKCERWGNRAKQRPPRAISRFRQSRSFGRGRRRRGLTTPRQHPRQHEDLCRPERVQETPL